MKAIIQMKLSNWNNIINFCRGNKFKANAYKKKEMKDISMFLMKLPKIEKYPVKITFKWHISNTGSDLDNKSCKSILDCLQNIGKLENDNINHINEIKYIAIKDNDDYVEMEIEYNGSD